MSDPREIDWPRAFVLSAAIFSITTLAVVISLAALTIGGDDGLVIATVVGTATAAVVAVASWYFRPVDTDILDILRRDPP